MDGGRRERQEARQRAAAAQDRCWHATAAAVARTPDAALPRRVAQQMVDQLVHALAELAALVPAEASACARMQAEAGGQRAGRYEGATTGRALGAKGRARRDSCSTAGRTSTRQSPGPSATAPTTAGPGMPAGRLPGKRGAAKDVREPSGNGETRRRIASTAQRTYAGRRAASSIPAPRPWSPASGGNSCCCLRRAAAVWRTARTVEKK